MDYAYYVLSMTASFLSRIRVPVELSYALASEHGKRLRESNPRKKNIKSAIAGDITRTHEKPIRYRGKFKWFRGSELTPIVQSYAVINNNVLHCMIDDIYYTKTAPWGTRWSIVDDSLVLIYKKTGDEIHVNTNDIINSTQTELKNKLLEIARIRRERRAVNFSIATEKLANIQSAIDKLSTLDVELTRDVSKKAGNCEVGTEKFLQMLSIADRHSINSKVLARIVKRKIGMLSEFERVRFLNVVNAL